MILMQKTLLALLLFCSTVVVLAQTIEIDGKQYKIVDEKSESADIIDQRVDKGLDFFWRLFDADRVLAYVIFGFVLLSITIVGVYYLFFRKEENPILADILSAKRDVIAQVEIACSTLSDAKLILVELKKTQESNEIRTVKDYHDFFEKIEQRLSLTEKALTQVSQSIKVKLEEEVRLNADRVILEIERLRTIIVESWSKVFDSLKNINSLKYHQDREIAAPLNNLILSYELTRDLDSIIKIMLGLHVEIVNSKMISVVRKNRVKLLEMQETEFSMFIQQRFKDLQSKNSARLFDAISDKSSMLSSFQRNISTLEIATAYTIKQAFDMHSDDTCKLFDFLEDELDLVKVRFETMLRKNKGDNEVDKLG